MSRSDANPAHDVLADLLLAAVEAGRLGETVELLSNLVGERPVREAVEVVFGRLAIAVDAAATPGPEPDSPDPASRSRDVFALTRRIRASTPGGVP